MDVPVRKPAFSLGDKVRLRADRQKRGAVVAAPRSHRSSYEYEVLIDGHEQWFSESQLERVSSTLAPRWVQRDELIKELTLAKLRQPLTDALYAYQASRTAYEPYQFRPALKFLRSGNQRLLIADEVGLGKTIEAAIIYLELKARLEIARVLVVCPSRLTVKWRDELRNRFEEEFEILDSAKVRRLLDDYRRLGAGISFRAIASFEMLRSGGILADLTHNHVPLDLLIVDEAHYMRNAEANTHRLGAVLVDNADAIVFLTATPLHLGNQDLFNLLTLLAPEDFDNPHLFDEQVRPNAMINRASNLLMAGKMSEAIEVLRGVESTKLRDRFLKNPYYTQILRRMGELRDLPSNLQDRVAVQWDLLSLNTLSMVMTRTRKREVAHGAARAPFSIRVRFTPEERAFYDAVVAYTREELRRTGSGATGFGTIMKERQAASCLAAYRDHLGEAETKRVKLEEEVDQSQFDLHDVTGIVAAKPAASLVRASKAIGTVDSKFQQFECTLRQALSEHDSSKALVFSFFKGTLRYLHRRLRSLGYPVEMIHGEVPIPDRLRIIDRFRSDPNQRILLSSEVGAEGLDFQFCDILVNYDLPWNPMQVEQRIGRLDRFGQQHERIRIYNFLIDDTIETRIFQRLYERIGIFERSIGDLEAILGEEIRDLSRKVIQGRLTDAEQARLADEAVARIKRRQLHEADLEAQKDELLGQGRILDARIEQTITSGKYISSDEVRALVGTYVRRQFPKSQLVFDDLENCATLQLDRAFAEHLRRFIERKRLSYGLSDRFKAALSEQRRLALTFDSALAYERPLLEFVTARHPLAQAAREYWQDTIEPGIPAAEIQISGPPDERGDGYFFIYLMTVTGMAESVTLEPVVVLEDGREAPVSAQGLLNSLQGGSANPTGIDRSVDGFLRAEEIAAASMASKRDQVEQEVLMKNEALHAARSASINASFDAKIRRTTELLGLASDPSIQRMRASQIQNLKDRRAVKLAELSRARNISVGTSLIAAGLIRITEKA